MERKCRKDKVFAKAYCDKIESYLQKGYLKKLTPEEAAVEPPHTWYLPHFATTNPNKPGKIRLVFDAAAKSHGTSLNDNLLTGPDLLQPLVAVLLRFRQRKIGFSGDIREMFHQVKMRQEDKCGQRLLWRNIDSMKEPEVYEMQVMTFGATCSPSCAQYIKNLNAQELADSPDILTAITRRFYVDDYLDSKDTMEEAVKTIDEVRRVQLLGGFEVVNWASNSTLVMNFLGEDMVDPKYFIENKEQMQRVLGVWWDFKTDNFKFKIQDDVSRHLITKRRILKVVMSLFDPLGLLCSLTLGAKILLQDIWRAGISWDDEIPNDIQKVWSKWLQELRRTTEIKIPRCYSTLIPSASEVELHIFCDGSEKAFASVAYLRIVTSLRIETSLVMAKSRVSPLKPLSIPRLELQAAVMASRLAATIKEELEIQIHQTYYWSDSRCVLKWIKGDGRKYTQFVSHRIGEIQERSDPKNWYWISTKLNIADAATRYKVDEENAVFKRSWFTGPDFLRQSKEQWPDELGINEGNQKLDNQDRIEDISELKSEFIGTIGEEQIEANRILDFSRFSIFLRLIRTVAWVFRFTEKLKNRIRKSVLQFPKCLPVEELTRAKNFCIRVSQEDSFSEDIRTLKREKTVNRRSPLRKLCPILDDKSVLVLGGRTNLAPYLEARTKQPYILSPKHPFTKLLIRHYHESFSHQGVETVLNEIRQNFWIVDARAAVKSAARNCRRCMKLRVLPQPPIMGQLPKERLTPGVRAFMNVGMDYFGPYFVSVGRRREKRWGVMFTCLAVRAIHLEIAHSLSTDSAIMAIRRFISRRGHPDSIFCDNGTNLRGASEELRLAIKELEESTIIDTLSSKGIQFRFIPPGAPHMGGAWERLIGSVKKSLVAVVYGQSMKDETLFTLFTEAESMINSRPLTHVSIDPADPEALTPNHFLVGYAHSEGPPGNFDSGKFLKKEWRKSQMLANSFWRRWVKEYLPSLNQRKKWTDTQKPLKINDIVIIVDENSPRSSWKIGKVVSVYPGVDGHIRVVDIQANNKIYKRPVTKLCRLMADEE